MLYTEMTIRAMKLAYDAHQGQLDKSGMPYIFHPYHLAEQMDDEVSCTVALLHDVAEDTPITLEELEKLFPPAVIIPLRLLTHQEGVPYEDYVRAIKQDPIAKKVKLADIRHNSDQSRCILSDIPPQKLLYWQEKYNKALMLLQD